MLVFKEPPPSTLIVNTVKPPLNLTRGQLNKGNPAGYKTCYVCKVSKELSAFGKHSTRYDGKQTYCLSCAREKQTEWYYSRKHGIKLDERNTILSNQAGKCAICGKPTAFEDGKQGRQLNTGDAAVVDHCHDSKRIRGILCGFCNIGLGAFKDNADSLMKAVEYLVKAGEK